MVKPESLKDIVSFNTGFKSAINLYLNLNNRDKILGYIPTSSSVSFLLEYVQAVINNKEQATLLVGPYGKGKSHLLLVLLSVLSMDRNEENSEIVKKLIEKLQGVDELGIRAAAAIKQVWEEKGRFLPVLISYSQNDLNQAFLYALSEALKRNHLDDLVPDTSYSLALKRISDWKEKYVSTFEQFEMCLREKQTSAEILEADLKMYSKEALGIFMEVYPRVTAGSEFNPLATSEVLPLYKDLSEKLYTEHGYSGIYIVFDEFSKFIENQDGTSAGGNMKLLQDICELSSESKSSQVFITMVAHKSIKEYGKYLSVDTINSFTGIEGRIIEKYFVTSSKNNYELIRSAIIKDTASLLEWDSYEYYLGTSAADNFYRVPFFKTNFGRDDFINIIHRGCYPLNPVSAYLLLNISEKVAQNERTLFTFISNSEPHSMARYVEEHTSNQSWNIGADLIYDYFGNLFKKEIVNEHVHNQWLNAEYAISKCDTKEQKRMIKALAVFIIVNKEEELPANDSFLGLASNVDDFVTVLDQLLDKQLIFKKGSTNCYVFKTRAGSALKSEIKRRREVKGWNVNIPEVLMEITQKYFVIPKRYNNTYSMTRYFRHEYMDADDFLKITRESTLFYGQNFADGKVITIISKDSIDQNVIQKHLAEIGSKRLVVVCAAEPFALVKQARDYEIIQELKGDHSFIGNNEIMTRELPLLEEDIAVEISAWHSIAIDDNSESKLFFYSGTDVVTMEGKYIERAVNSCCESVYPNTPVINNEMINRVTIATAQTKKARLNIVKAILYHKDNEDFYAGTNQEATIYRSLFCRTGILSGETEPHLQLCLDIMTNFVLNSSDIMNPMDILVDELTSAPFGMRKAVIPVFWAWILAGRREDIVVYFSGMEVQLSAEVVINMCENSEDYSLFVSKEDIQKEKYIESLNELFHVNENVNLSDNRIKDILTCMQRWFRALPQVSRNINKTSHYDIEPDVKKAMIQLKKILQKVEINPFETLFVKIPEMFSSDKELEMTFNTIDQVKTAFEDYYDWILNHAAKRTYDAMGIRKRTDLYHGLKEWYEAQSILSKRGLHSSRVTSMMTLIEKLNVFDDQEIVKKLIKAVTDVYIENWDENSCDDYINILVETKQEIESIREDNSEGKRKLSFVGKNGTELVKYYEPIDDDTGSVLRNIIEDTLVDFDDIPVNDRVAILLEMIEKLIG